MTYDVELDGHRVAVSVREHPEGGWWVAVGEGAEQHYTGARLGRAEWLLEGAGKQHHVGVFVSGDRTAVQLAGQGIVGSVVDVRDQALAKAGGATEGVVSTPMPGLIVRIPVAVGQAVHAGQVLIVVEAMKMENEYKSPVDGVVSTIHVAPGVAVEAGTVLITVEPS